MSNQYFLIDSGNQKKLEQFGSYRIIRPCSQALWTFQKPEEWKLSDATFDRVNGWRGDLPDVWEVSIDGLLFKISPTDFGHMGVFPEHEILWNWASELMEKPCKILNLFAYSGGATLSFARAGCEVCHLDASRPIVSWARENAKLNHLETCSIRWIVDDALKFLKRELRRGNSYDGILLDPPSFGRGTNKQVFKIERDILPLLHLCKQLLSKEAQFFAFSTHTPGMTPQVLRHLLEEVMQSSVESGEMILRAIEGKDLPCGSYARWRR